MRGRRLSIPILAGVCALFCALGFPGKSPGGSYKDYIEKLTAPEGEGAANEHFGSAVAEHQNDIIIGVPYRTWGEKDSAGTVYFFDKIGNNCISRAVTIQEGDLVERGLLGSSVSLYDRRAMAGAPHFIGLGGYSSVFAFTQYVYDWQHTQTLYYPDHDPDVPAIPFFGCAVSVNDYWAVVGAKAEDGNGELSGAVYIYHRTGDYWDEPPLKKYPEDGVRTGFFGYSVSIDRDSVIAVGAPRDSVNGECTGSVYIYRRLLTEWIFDTKITAATSADGDMFGYSVDLSGDTLVVGAPYHGHSDLVAAGAAYVYAWDPIDGWTGVARLRAEDAESGDYFGVSVSVRRDSVLVGAERDDNSCGHNSGSAYLFWRIEDRWENLNMRAPDCTDVNSGKFGSSVSLGPDYAVIGAPDDDNENGAEAGAAYVISEPYSENRYFVHVADMHVLHPDNAWMAMANEDWKKCFDKVLNLRPQPEFVTVSGDIADYGQRDRGAKNYDFLLGYDHLYIFVDTIQYDPVVLDEQFYLADLSKGVKIPVFFCPGNHDYRGWKYDATSEGLDNYCSKLGLPFSYGASVGPYRIYSIDSGHDVFEDAWALPEGSGLGIGDMSWLEASLDSIDGAENSRDTSSCIKVVMMHHPHDNRRDREHDGEFMNQKSWYTDVLRKYEVDFALYGHMHKKKVYYFDRTKCVICKPAEEGSIYEVPLFNFMGVLEHRLWSTIDLTYLGDLEVYANDGFGNRTGMYYGVDDTLTQLQIPNSLYHSYSFTNDFVPETVDWNEVTVYKADSLDYVFFAEAKSNDEMTIQVDVKDQDGSNLEVEFTDVQMYYNGGLSPPASLAILTATGSLLDTQLRIFDPGADRGGDPSRVVPPTSVDITDAVPAVAGFALHPVFPNPFNPSTTVRFDLPSAARVRLCVYNVKGELVSVLVNGRMSAGSKEARWDGMCDSGSPAASGVYFCRLAVDRFERTRKLVLLK